MVAYSFKAQFRDAILSGAKRQTVRADRNRHARPGETLQLYIGMRTRNCQLIARPICTDVRPIRLDFARRWLVLHGSIWRGARLDAFAKRDGFPDWPALEAFWRQEHPGVENFVGVLIEWGVLNPATAP